MAVSEQDVRHVAALARLGLDAARVPALVEELNRILEHMEVLQQVTLQSDSGVSAATTGLPTRDDVVHPVPLEVPREAFAPLMRDGFFLVPRLATHGTAGQSVPNDDDAGDEA